MKIGGKTLSEAQQVLIDYPPKLRTEVPQLIYQDQVFNPNSSDIGLSFDPQKTIEEAHQFGRQGSVLTRIKENWQLAFYGYDIALVTSLDQDKISQYIDSVASKIDVAASDRKILETTGKVVDEGRDGLNVDKTKLADLINNNILSNSLVTQISIPVAFAARSEKQVKEAFTPGDYTGRYIEVNLSEQTLYAYENNKIVKQFLISGGVATHPTVTGIFYVYAKSRVTEMKGEGYDLPGVQWVSWFYGDYSIHGTYWHHNFGHPMSHGCVNASNADAKWIYDWDEIGTPVWIHR